MLVRIFNYIGGHMPFSRQISGVASALERFRNGDRVEAQISLKRGRASIVHHVTHASLVRMQALGMPVPPGFIILTDAGRDFAERDFRIPTAFQAELSEKYGD